MKWARLIGMTLQALVLGALLFVAILRMISPAGAGRVFHYQGF